MAPKLNETDAKQGRSGRPILLVLIAGLALIIIGYLVIGGIGVSTSPDGDLTQTETLPGAEEPGNNVAGETVTPGESDVEPTEGVNVPN